VNGIPQSFGKDSRFNGIQAGIAVPLWFPPYTSRAKAAKVAENIAQTNAENYARSIYGSYQSLLDEYKKYTSTVDFYENQAVPESDLIIEQATLSYKAGALDYLDYVLTLDRALAIKQKYLDAINSYNQTIISIEYITGKIY
jgi:cobalt-zinc-cadmium resistance protein CzcA